MVYTNLDPLGSCLDGFERPSWKGRLGRAVVEMFVFSRRHVQEPTKDQAKVTLVAESDLLTDFSNRLVR